MMASMIPAILVSIRVTPLVPVSGCLAIQLRLGWMRTPLT